jgi:hypothetical protein
MKKKYCTLLSFLVLAAGVQSQTTLKTRTLKPSNYQERVIIDVAGKNRSYYMLSNDKPSVITTTGPGKLKIISRPVFVRGQKETARYEINYIINGGITAKYLVSNGKPSTKDTFEDGPKGIPGQPVTFEIDLGRGTHTIEFLVGNSKFPVCARYIFIPVRAKHQDWIPFSPLRPSEPVELISRESTVLYYRFSNEKPMKVELNGPTEIRVLTRAENHYRMRGTINYRVQVRENDMVLNTYQLSSLRSEVTAYKDDYKLVPGKACEFVISVPKGRHIYEIKLLENDQSTVLGRLLIPREAVKLGK